MTPLDDNNYIDQSTVSMMPTAIRYGLIGSLILIISSLALNLLGMGAGSGSTTISSIISLVVFGGVIYMALTKHRDEDLGGYMTYGRAIALGTLACLIMGIVGGIFSYIYVSFIDPSVMDLAWEQARAQYETMGMSDDEIENALEMAKKFSSGPMIAVFSIIGYVIMGFIASLIVGAVVKNNPPELY